MRVIGLDPGTVVIGFGLIEGDADNLSFIDCGTIKCDASSPIAGRLCHLYAELSRIIERYRPDVAAIEQPFIAKNAKSALAIGKAQAVCILAVANSGIPVYDYAPRQVKQAVSGYGASSKEQVQEMVRIQLGLDSAPQPADASDALAVAICHIGRAHVQSLLAE